MKNIIKQKIENELKRNATFNNIFNKFKFPEINITDDMLNLVYKSNEYMGFYKKELYLDLIPREQISEYRGTLKITFVSSEKNFNIEKAMHLLNSNEVHNVSLTFMIYSKEGWDTERYNYTLWKDCKKN